MYSLPGQKEVRLIAKNPIKNDTISTSLFVGEDVVADFSFDEQDVYYTGNSIEFQSQSKGTDLKHKWYVNTNLVSETDFFTLNLDTSKTYDIKLEVENEYGMDEQNWIISNVRDHVKASFDYSTTGFSSGDIMNFNSTSTGSDLNYQWFVNNDLISENISFEYRIPYGLNSLSVKLIAKDQYETSETNVLVFISEDVVADFSFDEQDVYYIGNSIEFQSQSKGTNLKHKWYVNTNLVSETDFLTLNLDASKTYDIELEVENEYGMDEQNWTISNVRDHVKASFDYSTTGFSSGDLMIFNSTSTGSDLNYQWFINNDLVSDNISFEYHIPYDLNTLSVKLIAKDEYETSETNELVFTITGIQTNQYSELNIYPNPVRDFLYIKGLSHNSIISLYDLKAVKLMELKNTDRINLNRLNPGVYILNIVDDNKLVRKKIIKQ